MRQQQRPHLDFGLRALSFKISLHESADLLERIKKSLQKKHKISATRKIRTIKRNGTIYRKISMNLLNPLDLKSTKGDMRSMNGTKAPNLNVRNPRVGWLDQ